MNFRKLLTQHQLLESGLVPWRSRMSIHRAIHNGLPVTTINGRLYFEPVAVTLWMRRQGFKIVEGGRGKANGHT